MPEAPNNIPLWEAAPAPKLVRDSLTESGPVYARVRGTFLRKGAISLNGRYYSPKAVEEAVAQADRRLKDPHALPITMVTSHGAADKDQILETVGKVTAVGFDGDDAYYEADIANTALGRDVATLIQGGFHRSVSLRAEDGSARVSPCVIEGRPLDQVDAFALAAIDYTTRPGFPDIGRVNTLVVESTTPQAPHFWESVDPRAVAGTVNIEEAMAAESSRWYQLAETLASADLQGHGGIGLTLTVREFGPLMEKFQDPGHYTVADRKKIPAEDFGEPPDGYPIFTQKDVEDAAHLIGKAADPERVKARIIRIARRKGFKLPDAWKDGVEDEDGDASSTRESLAEDVNVDGPSAALAAKAIDTDTSKVPMDWMPCSYCASGKESQCTCPGCKGKGACWCCAGRDGVDRTVPVNPKESHGDLEIENMTPEELSTLVATQVRESLASILDPFVEAERRRLAADDNEEQDDQEEPEAESTDEDEGNDQDDMDDETQGDEEDGDEADDEPAPAPRVGSRRDRDHLRTAHDHIAHTMGKECAGKGGQSFGETWSPKALRALRESFTSAFDPDHRDRLALAHDHIATVLGMECSNMEPSGPLASGEEDKEAAEDNAVQPGAGKRRLAQERDQPIPQEALTRKDLPTLVEALAKAMGRTPAKAAPARRAVKTAPVREAKPAVDPILTAIQAQMSQMAELAGKLVESQTTTASQVKNLSETLPQAVATAAAEAATNVAWRPNRRTQVNENKDAAPGAATQSAEDMALAYAKDQTIPVEDRLFHLSALMTDKMRQEAEEEFGPQNWGVSA